MRLVVIAQDEPVYMAPFLARVLQARSEDVVAVALGPLRDSGRPPRNRREHWDRLRTLWLLFGTWHFLRALSIRLTWRLFRPTRRSLDRTAHRLGIPVLRFTDPNRPAFLQVLRSLEPDVVINQSDFLLQKPLLELPRVGVINRHGSRLPHHRGRLASFWQHREGEGRFWVTVHFVDEGLDTGPIILQRSFEIPAAAEYGAVLKALFEASTDVVLEALELLDSDDFETLDNPADEGSSHRHPTLEEARAWRKERARRGS